MVNVSSVILNNGLSMPIVGLGTWNVSKIMTQGHEHICAFENERNFF